MKVSLNWIKKYIILSSYSAEEIADKLTFAGVEVETIDKLATASNLIIGEVLKCEKIKESDHLNLTEVNCGAKHGVIQIVCGAPNVRTGIKVIVALPGAKLGNINIKKGNIKGYESNGMICSLVELGVDTKYLTEEQVSGIEILDSEAAVGNEDVLQYLSLDDTIFNLKLLANRSDLYSLLNIVKELSTLFEEKCNIPSAESLINIDEHFKVGSITDKCRQISLKVIKDIKVCDSPKWLKEVLRSSGIRSINSIVDIGNYIMLLTGQPIHMYDLDKLPKAELIVKDNVNCVFNALDGKDYNIIEGDICITSDNQIMCLGGIMGSSACSVDENTKNIVIESANFDFATIRRTSSRLSLSSDSSMRFTKGINPNQYSYVLDLTSNIIKELCDGKFYSQQINYIKEVYLSTEVQCTYNYINSRLGTDFSKEEILKVLKRDWIEVKCIDDKSFVAVIPSSRIDITSGADLSEEVIRILGFDNIVSYIDNMSISIGGMHDNISNKNSIRSYLTGIGLDEQITYTLVDETKSKQWNFLHSDNESLFIMNELTEERKFIRTSIMPSLIESVLYNVNHGTLNFSYYEVSDIVGKNDKYCDVGIILCGNDQRRHKLSNEKYSFYHMKGIVEGILELFNIGKHRYSFVRTGNEFLHPGKSANLVIDGKVIGFIGELHPKYSSSLGIAKNNVVCCELSLSNLFQIKTNKIKMSPISKFPSITRDLSFIVDKNISAKDIELQIKKCGKDVISSIEVFDVYNGCNISEDKVALGFKINFSSLLKTFTIDEIQIVETNIIDTLFKKYNAVLRT